MLPLCRLLTLAAVSCCCVVVVVVVCSSALSSSARSHDEAVSFTLLGPSSWARHASTSHRNISQHALQTVKHFYTANIFRPLAPALIAALRCA